MEKTKIFKIKSDISLSDVNIILALRYYYPEIKFEATEIKNNGGDKNVIT